MAYQVGGWYQGKQYGADGSFSAPGEYNPTVSGQSGMAPVQNAQDQAFINQQRVNPSPMVSPSVNIPTSRPANTSMNIQNQMTPNGWANNQSMMKDSGYLPYSPNMSKTTSLQFPSLVKTAYASEMTPSASLKRPTFDSTYRNPEVPRDSGGRSQVVQGTPSWVIPILQKASEKTGVPMAVLSAVAKHESAETFDPTIRQRGFGLGRGMFQIDIGQHKSVTEDEAFDPNFAANFAANLLKEGFDRTGSWEGALRYYNGGPAYNSNRPGYNGRPVSELTGDYARKVEAYLNKTIPVENPDYKKKISKALGS